MSPFTAWFQGFLLKPGYNVHIGDCGFEHPSEVQHECIPGCLGMDICARLSLVGKDSSIWSCYIQQLEPVDGQVSVFW